jgi:hypothetical protein
MTITVALTPAEEAKLAALAEGRGMSPDALVMNFVRDIIERSAPLSSKAGEFAPEESERRMEELFESFDNSNVSTTVSEEAFHRDNWYR